MDPRLIGLHNKMMANQRAEQLMSSLGLYGQLRHNSKYAKYEGAAASSWEGSRSVHPGGTIEINKIVLAGRGLGLPRVPAKFNKEIRDAVEGKS